MKLLFDKLSAQVSKQTTQLYSTSFSLGIYFLHPRIRDSIYSIYGFVRLADEIVDSFEGYNKKLLLERLHQETFESIKMGISINPIIHSFQEVVNRYRIDEELIRVFLNSMEMDLNQIQYNQKTYEQYILGSAEVVGLMCLAIFTEGNKNLFEDLKPYAMKLGAAFQKVNFLRDLKDDYQLLGRTYFPNINMSDFNTSAKKQIEEEIESDFQVALMGIKKLPYPCKGGVYLAYLYYYSLFNKIKKLPVHKILNERVRIHNGKKFSLMFNSFLMYKMNWV